METEGAWAGGECSEEEEATRERESVGESGHGDSVSRSGFDAGSYLDTRSHLFRSEEPHV